MTAATQVRPAMHFDWTLNLGQIFTAVSIIAGFFWALWGAVGRATTFLASMRGLQENFTIMQASIDRRMMGIETELKQLVQITMTQHDHNYRLQALERMQGIPPDITRLIPEAEAAHERRRGGK